jgi:hypothetical protein
VSTAGCAFVTVDPVFLRGEATHLGGTAPEVGPVTFGAGVALFESALSVIGDPALRVPYLGLKDRLLVALRAGGRDESRRQ